MTELVAYLTVLVAAAIPWLEVLFVVPAGIVAGLPPAPVVVVAAVGNLASLVPLITGGERLRAWWQHRRGRTDGVHGPSDDEGEGVSRRDGRARRLFDRYGLPGLAAAGPLVTGIHVAALVALAAGGDRRRMLLWMSSSVVVWAAIAAAATVIGIESLVDPDQLPDLGLSVGQLVSRSTIQSTVAV